jgi:hypothetical protein
MARLTWVFTVAGLSTSRPAMSSLDSPSPTRLTSCRSRSVSTSILVAGGGGLARSANSLISRRVTLGDSSASPVATTRTARTSSAGSVCLTRKPLAPARSASNTYSSSSNVVRITTRTPASRPSPAIGAWPAARPSRAS